MKRGVISIGTFIYVAIVLMIFAALMPLFNSAINSAWSYLNPVGKALAAFIIPAFLIGIILTPFDLQEAFSFFRREQPPRY